jgi:sialic acid synthase SpsE
MVVGDICQEENISFLKPMIGIDSMEFETVLGKRVTRPVAANTPVSFEDFGMR